MLKYHFYATLDVPDDKVLINNHDETQSILVKFTVVSDSYDAIEECDDAAMEYIEMIMDAYDLKDTCDVDVMMNPVIEDPEASEEWGNNNKLFMYIVGNDNDEYMTLTIEATRVADENIITH